MTIHSYNLQGLKQNFADWIANITPEKTPFISCIGVDTANGTTFQWQGDRGSFVSDFKNKPAEKEGDDVAAMPFTKGTELYTNQTQIFRRIVKISETVLSSSVYGKEDELAYQLAKASIDLKREIEYCFLNNGAAVTASDAAGGVTAGFLAQCATPTPYTKGSPLPTTNADTQTGAITHIQLNAMSDLDDTAINLLTLNLFKAGSCANTIMYNPNSKEIVDTLKFMADGDTKVPSQTRLQWFKQCENGDSREIMTFTDSIGQTFQLIPSVWMPENTIYFFDCCCWDMVVFREPEPQKLDTEGSNRVYLVECEVGLRHAHPHASGVISLKP